MGFPPPADAPAPDVNAAPAIPESPSGSSVCGFSVPSFEFPLPVPPGLPSGLFTFPPVLLPLLPLNCDLADKFDLPSGGGRQGTLGLEDDPEFGPET